VLAGAASALPVLLRVAPALPADEPLLPEPEEALPVEAEPVLAEPVLALAPLLPPEEDE
jgi:hypothetical protein